MSDEAIEDGFKRVMSTTKTCTLTCPCKSTITWSDIKASAAAVAAVAEWKKEHRLHRIDLDPGSSFKQAWGVAFRRGSAYEWCYGEGPEGWNRVTKRRAMVNALASNGCGPSGPYVALPLPGLFATKDMEPYVHGVHSDRCEMVLRAAHELLLRAPETEYSELPFDAQFDVDWNEVPDLCDVSTCGLPSGDPVHAPSSSSSTWHAFVPRRREPHA